MLIKHARVLLLVFWLGPGVAWAQPANVVRLEPMETDTIGCRFNSWTLTGAGTASIALIGIPSQADATPTGVITAGPTLAANTVTVRLAPDTGCGTAGCRNGNSYQVRLQPVAGSDQPTCNFRLDVRRTTLVP